MSSQDRTAIVTQFIEQVINAKNFDQLDVLCHEDFTFRGMMAVGHGRQAYRRVIRDVLTALPDANASIDTIIAQNDHVFVSVLFRATFQRNFRGLRATRRRLSLPMHMVFRFRDGMVADLSVLYDSRVFQEQSGAEIPREQVWWGATRHAGYSRIP